ncbi:hypothetical protein TNIN_281681 [Trichonephila inaurata madagascariensis]|uniref:Uncharacterized protein n=1 Tax=Trichonephila inaurata madagascariensis TaxID=2747483 RepID=A0A8X6YLI0_9ARAC|nr:hypothetical protein TNIN_281681 [Trichonephila inaurata madagascariensis]
MFGVTTVHHDVIDDDVVVVPIVSRSQFSCCRLRIKKISLYHSPMTKQVLGVIDSKNNEKCSETALCDNFTQFIGHLMNSMWIFCCPDVAVMSVHLPI